MAEKSALIVGAGSGISAAFARALHRDGYKVALSARNTDKLAGLAKETGAVLIAADATKADAVKALFAEVDRALRPPRRRAVQRQLPHPRPVPRPRP